MITNYTEQLGNGDGVKKTFTKVLTYIPSSMNSTYFSITINNTSINISLVGPVGGVYSIVQTSFLDPGSEYNSNTRTLTLKFKVAPLVTEFVRCVYQTDSQILSFQYRGEGKSKYFNSVLHNLLPMGIYSKETVTNGVYSYAEGQLAKVNNGTVSVSPFVALVRDVENNLSVRLQTMVIVNVDVTPATPYIIAKINWQNAVSNYAEIQAVSFASIQPDYLIIGKCYFDVSNYVLDYFDYSRRHHVDVEANYVKQATPFRVMATEPESDKVLVQQGDVTFSTGSFHLNDDSLSPAISASIAGRIDLVYIDQNGTVQVVSGADNASPVAPNFAGKFVVAQIKRIGASSVIKGHQITQVNPHRYFITNAEHPTFNRVTLLLPPVDDSDAVRKDYVDNLIRGLDWQESVKSFLNFTTNEPSTRTNGDRYIALSTGTSNLTSTGITINKIYQWDTAVTPRWLEITPDKGTVVLDESTGIQWTWNDVAWVQFSSTVNHNILSCLQGGTSGQYYHLTATQCQNVFYRNTHTTDNITQGSTNKWYADSLVNTNACVTCARNHVNVVGNPHGTTHSTISDFQSGVSSNVHVSCAYTHACSVGNLHNMTKADVGLSNVLNVAQVPAAEKGVANGVATLDSNGLIPSAQINNEIVTSLKYKGTWNASTNTPNISASPQKGDYYVVSVAGSTSLTGGGNVWRIGDWAVYNGATFDRLKLRDEITSVNGVSEGAVVLTTSHIAEGSRLYYTEARVTANTTVQEAYNHISSDGSSHSEIGVLHSKLSDQKNTGFISWLNSGAYHSVVGTTFTLLRGGTGRIASTLVTWAGNQNVTLVQGTNYVYINSSGTLASTIAYTPSLYEDNIVLFKVYYHTSITKVTRDNHAYKLNTGFSVYSLNNIGPVVRGSGGKISQITTGFGSLPSDRQIRIVGDAILDDNMIESNISDTGASPITFDFLYKNAANVWIKSTGGTELPMKYTNVGVYTDIPTSGSVYGVWTIYAIKSDLNSDNVSYVAVANKYIYSSLGDAKTAVRSEELQMADYALEELEPALLGFVIVSNNGSGGRIEKLYVKKANIANNPLVTYGSDFISDDGTKTLINSDTVITGNLSVSGSIGSVNTPNALSFNSSGFGFFTKPVEVISNNDDPYIVLRKTGMDEGAVKIIFNTATKNVDFIYE